MFLRIYYSPRDIEILAVISDNGDIYWSGSEVCKILNYSHPSSTLKRHLKGENLTKITNIIENCFLNNYVLTYDQIIKLFNNIPEHRRVKMFEEWFENVNNGCMKIYSRNPEFLQQYLCLQQQKNNNWFKATICSISSLNNCLRFNTTLLEEEEEEEKEKLGNQYETTLPDILYKRRLVISSSNFGIKEENGEENNNLMNDYLNCSNGEHMEDEGRQQKTSSSFFELKEKWCDKSKSFFYRDEHSGETYEYIAIDLNWKCNEMRPIHIYPALRFEEDGAFLYVPFKQQTLKNY